MITSDVSHSLAPLTMLHSDSNAGAGVIQPFFSQFQRTSAAAAMNGFHRADLMEETGLSEVIHV